MNAKWRYSKSLRIQKALDTLNRALAMEEPQIQIDLQGGFDPESQRAKEFMAATKAYVRAYKHFFGPTVDGRKVRVKLVL